MTKYKVTWWFKDAIDGVSRGTDIVDLKTEDLLEAEDLVDDLARSEMDCCEFDENEPRLLKLRENANSPCPENWKILNVKKVEKK